jgi:hypothetical protein
MLPQQRIGHPAQGFGDMAVEQGHGLVGIARQHCVHQALVLVAFMPLDFAPQGGETPVALGPIEQRVDGAQQQGRLAGREQGEVERLVPGIIQFPKVVFATSALSRSRSTLWSWPGDSARACRYSTTHYQELRLLHSLTAPFVASRKLYPLRQQNLEARLSPFHAALDRVRPHYYSPKKNC